MVEYAHPELPLVVQASLLGNIQQSITTPPPPELPLVVQASLLGLSRSSLYYQPVPPAPHEVALKHRIDELYTAHPY